MLLGTFQTKLCTKLNQRIGQHPNDSAKHLMRITSVSKGLKETTPNDLMN